MEGQLKSISHVSITQAKPGQVRQVYRDK